MAPYKKAQLSPMTKSTVFFPDELIRILGRMEHAGTQPLRKDLHTLHIALFECGYKRLADLINTALRHTEAVAKIEKLIEKNS